MFVLRYTCGMPTMPTPAPLLLRLARRARGGWWQRETAFLLAGFLSCLGILSLPQPSRPLTWRGLGLGAVLLLGGLWLLSLVLSSLQPVLRAAGVVPGEVLVAFGAGLLSAHLRRRGRRLLEACPVGELDATAQAV